MSIYLGPFEDDVMDDYQRKEDLGICRKCGRVGCECDPETCDCDCHTPPQEKQLSIDFE